MSFNISGATAQVEAVSVAEPSVGEQQKTIQGKSPWVLAWRRLRRDRASMISLGIIIFIVICAIAAPVFAAITGHGNMTQYNVIGRTPEGQPVGPSSTFWLPLRRPADDVVLRHV